MRMTKLIKGPDIITSGNLICGILSMLFAIQKEFTIAAILLIGSLVCDYFDGKVARWTNTVSEWGKEMDSLADMVSFGVAPVMFGYMLGFDNWIAMVCMAFFSVCGIMRLARFNITAGKVKGYEGMPITWNAAIFVILYFTDAYVYMGMFFPAVYVVCGLLMASSIRIKKII